MSVMISYCLHRSRYGRDTMLKYLIEHTRADPDCVAANNQTVFDIIQSTDGIRLLLTLGATPNCSLDEQFFPSYLRQDSDDMSIKMFVLGNTGSGKSTLSKSLELDRKGFSRFKSRFIKVKGVDVQTAGIIPHDIIRKAMGSITIFDFAGDKMFYAGHDALLSNAMATSPSIILLTADLSDEEEAFRETLLYWLEFINNRCSKQGSSPHLILIGSHADQSMDVQAKSQLMKSLADSSKFDGLTFAGQVTLDCRFAESTSMAELISLLTQSCHALRNPQKLPFETHCFLQFLLKYYEDTPALTLGTAEAKLGEATKEEIYLTFLKSHNLFEICEQLNQRGNILFMKDVKNPLNSWIILDKSALLSKVFGAVFAPQGFKEHHGIANSAGIVPLSKLSSILPDFNSDMITQFLCHMRFCREVLNHQRVPCLQIEADNATFSASERFFFFPGLVQLHTPVNLWQPGNQWEYNSGWLLQCSIPGQFLTSRLIQVQLLQLFDLATSNMLEQPSKACHVWDNGVAWTDKSGTEVIVEVVDRKAIVVLTRCRQSEMLNMVRLRSTIVKSVLEIKNEICPKVSTHESLIVPECLSQYPLKLPDAVTAIGMVNVTQAIIHGKSTVSIDDGNTFELDKVLQFEPYAQLGEHILRELFVKKSRQETEDIDEIFRQVVERVPHKAALFKTVMISLSSCQSIQSDCGDSAELQKVFQVWKDELLRQVGTARLNLLSELRTTWDRYSIFAGRNIFD